MAYNVEKQEHAFKKFNRDLKEGNFNPVILLYGVEEYLINWAANALVKKYVNSATISMDYQKINVDDQTSDNIINAAETYSMFSEKRVVWVNDFQVLKSDTAKGFDQAQKKALMEYIANPNEGAILIFSAEEINEKTEFVKFLLNCADVYNFTSLDRPQLLGFIEKRFKSSGVSIDKQLLNLLIDESGYYLKDSNYRLFNMESDIAKICAHQVNGVVTEKDIEETLNGEMNTFVFDFTDAISSNKKDVAYELLHNILYSGKDPFFIASILIKHFELLLQVKEFSEEGISQAEMAKKLKVHEFRVKKAFSNVRMFSIDKLRSILSQLYEVDKNVKMGLMDGTLNLELILGRI